MSEPALGARKLGKKRAHVFVSGRVQGVMFRETTRREAEARGVTGWVRNLPDGRVEAVFEGEEPEVQEMVDWCRRGPSRSRVDGVDVQWDSYQGEYDDFQLISGWSW